jgi:predicted flap endonuclease-1-like 5' DNA nuclease
LETELERVHQESAAAQQAATTTPPDSTDTSQQLNELHATHQQAVADLSLANESVKQLNQQLMLRDVAFSQLEHEKQQLARQLAEHNDKLEQQEDELRENLEKETGQFKQAAKKLRDTANEQLKQLAQRDARLQDVAVKLSKLRGEVVSLNSQLHEQKALVRALRTGQKTQSHPIENGQPTPPLATKLATKPRHATRMRTDAQLGQLYNHPPDEVDDLQQINGIGPVLEKRLNEIGVYRYAQVKEWTNSVVEHLDTQLALRGRIVRDRWVQQARKLTK